ncbi:MAG: hydrogenase maturation nickel metallochaperone HypA [Pseudomonadota bacterium]
MHELGITRNVVSIVCEHAGTRPVKRVTLDIGKLSGIDARAIAFCFDVVAKGTGVEGASLVINEIDGMGVCNVCESAFPMPTLITPCPCGSRDTRRTAGEELKVREFEYAEVPEMAQSQAI